MSHESLQIEFRKKIVKAYSQGNTSIRKVAARFDVSKSFVQKLLEQQKVAGHLNPVKPGGGMNSELAQQSKELILMVAKYPDATLSEYCEYWGKTYERWVSTSTMCRALQRHRQTLKKNLTQ